MDTVSKITNLASELLVLLKGQEFGVFNIGPKDKNGRYLAFLIAAQGEDAQEIADLLRKNGIID